MKLVSFYLPQFHEIPENNDAWGRGFTEWTNVKKSVPFFFGHNQPRIPLNDNYYCLLEPGTLKWQVDLANKYGVDAFCLYHYWFNGRLVLEKPVEVLRNMPELDISYCFAWANEPWTKTWHGAGGEKEILIPQTYGREEEWERHYRYFLPYFQDGRYLKKDGRPVLLIYKLQNIPYYNDMIRYWKKRAAEDGFQGVFVLCMNTSAHRVYTSKWVDGKVDFEPNNTKAAKLMEPSIRHPSKGNGGFLRKKQAIRKISYSEINERMLETEHFQNEFRTVFIDYDDTPRRGANGVVTLGANPSVFQKYLKKNIVQAMQEKNDFLFVNAWNEWGEGNYLEPDEKNGYGYLEAVKKARKECKI